MIIPFVRSIRAEHCNYRKELKLCLSKKRLASICIAATCVFSASAAPVTSANRIYSNGDVNMDGNVDTVDAFIILEEYVRTLTNDSSGRLSREQVQLADVNQDGKIDTMDALGVLSDYSKSVVTLEWEVCPEDLNGKTKENVSIYGIDLEDNMKTVYPYLESFSISDSVVSIVGMTDKNDQRTAFQLKGIAYKTYDNNIVFSYH